MVKVLRAKFEHPDLPGAYVLLSGRRKDTDGIPGDWTAEPFVTFFYDAGTVGAEWEPKHGPIQIFTKADCISEGTKEHYFYPFVRDEPMAWSQIAVEREGLKEALAAGSFEYIFLVLKKWAEDYGGRA